MVLDVSMSATMRRQRTGRSVLGCAWVECNLQRDGMLGVWVFVCVLLLFFNLNSGAGGERQAFNTAFGSCRAAEEASFPFPTRQALPTPSIPSL
jgi:hypothetical protein